MCPCQDKWEQRLPLKPLSAVKQRKLPSAKRNKTVWLHEMFNLTQNVLYNLNHIELKEHENITIFKLMAAEMNKSESFANTEECLFQETWNTDGWALSTRQGGKSQKTVILSYGSINILLFYVIFLVVKVFHSTSLCTHTIFPRFVIPVFV